MTQIKHSEIVLERFCAEKFLQFLVIHTDRWNGLFYFLKIILFLLAHVITISLSLKIQFSEVHFIFR